MEYPLLPLRRVLVKIEQGWSPQASNLPAEDGEWGVLKLSAVSRGAYRPQENKALPASERPPASLEVSPGDLLMTRANTPDLVGDVCLARETPRYRMIPDLIYRLTAGSTATHEYLCWYLQSRPARAEIEVFARGASQSMVKIAQGHIRSLTVRLPPLDVQRAIADFLDRKTAGIDALIDKKERLLALLQEKRQALITQAVTKGLDPNVPMKDSGIEWLGEIPAHWGIQPLRRVMKEAVAGPYGASLTKAMYVASGFRVYGQQQVIPNDFSIGDYYIDSSRYQEMRRYRVYPHDLLVSVMGTVGRVAVVPEGVEPGIINPRLVRYRADPEVARARWLRAQLLSTPWQSKLRLEAQGATMDGLNMQSLGRVPLVLPPLAEQDGLVAYVENTERRSAELESRLTLSCDRLREYRQALITAAVTGQLDVTGEHA